MASPKNKKTVKKRSKKISVATKVKVVKLKCPNCGEEEERVLYCGQCESPMDIVEVLERDENEVNNDIAVSRDIPGSDKRVGGGGSSGGEGKATAEDVIPSEASAGMEEIMEKGLGDIFPGTGNDNNDSLHDDGAGGVDGMDLNAALDALDNE